MHNQYIQQGKVIDDFKDSDSQSVFFKHALMHEGLNL